MASPFLLQTYLFFWANSRNTSLALKRGNMWNKYIQICGPKWSKYIQTNCWHFRCRDTEFKITPIQNPTTTLLTRKFYVEHFSKMIKRSILVLSLFYKYFTISLLKCQRRMLSVWISNHNWQNVGLVLSFPQKPFKDRDEISEEEMKYIRCSVFSPSYFFSYAWEIVHFGETICYAAEIGESEGQTGKRQDVEFGKKQGRRISPSSGLCSPLLEMSTIEIISHLSSNFLWKAQKWGMLWVLLTDKASVNFTRNTEITTILNRDSKLLSLI